MSGYLDQYGQVDERREKRVQRIVIGVGIAALLALTFLVFLHNRSERQTAERFGEALVRQDYSGAYREWGCTEAKPCRDYKFERFDEDWGRKSRYGAISSFRVVRTSACGTGVMVSALVNRQVEKLWVERKDQSLSFAPWPVCPKRDFTEIVLDRFKDWLGIGIEQASR